MKARITELNLKATKQANGKTLTGISISYQGQPFKGQIKPPTTRFIFNNSPIAPPLLNGEIKQGDWVELTFDESRYKNPQSIKKIDDPTEQHTQQPAQSTGKTKHHTVAGMSYNERMNVLADLEDEKQVRIARSTALKSATDIVLFSAKKTEAGELLAERVVDVSRILEKYLTLNDGKEEITSSMESVKAGGDFDQEQFKE